MIKGTMRPDFPAFPYSVKNTGGENLELFGFVAGPGHTLNFPGLTIRDYFAAASIPALFTEFAKALDASTIAAIAYAQADAMLAERAK